MSSMKLRKTFKFIAVTKFDYVK